VLLASSLLLPPASLAALVYARLQEAHGLAVSSLRVLRCLASHLNTADNYVWPSLPCVAFETGLSETQAGRALRALAAAGAVRVVTDGAEVAAIERRRPGRRALPGNVYDLSPLLRWVPACLVRAVVRPPRSALSEGGSAPVLAASPPVASLPPAPSCLSFDNKKAEGKAHPAAVERPVAFHTPKKTPETKVSPASLGLHGAGVSPAVAAQIIADKGEAWALRLLAYGRSRPSPVGAGWLVRVWQGWEGWPDRFEEQENREAARSARIVRAPSPLAFRVTPAVGTKPESGPGAAPGASGGLPGVIPASVAARALAAVVAGLPAGLRRIVEARGVDHRLVQAAARRLMANDALPKDALPKQEERIAQKERAAQQERVGEGVSDGDVANERPSGGVGRGGGGPVGPAGGGAGGSGGRGDGGRTSRTEGGAGERDSGGGGSGGDAGTGGDGRAP